CNHKQNCPICKRKSSTRKSRCELTLKELADSFAGRLNVGSSETEKGEKKVEVVCSKHQEEPKLFCKDETELCVLSVIFLIIKKKYEETQKTYNEIIQHLKKQVLFTENQIRAEFNKLQQFLKEEEESRLAALREEEEQKRRSVIREMKRIEEQMSSVSDIVRHSEQSQSPVLILERLVMLKPLILKSVRGRFLCCLRRNENVNNRLCFHFSKTSHINTCRCEMYKTCLTE
uniref:Uncharacterized protein n=1 Tax=Sphaeramia orbicularis TaxID=375764 RepID=A0A672YJK4_9TELE